MTGDSVCAESERTPLRNTCAPARTADHAIQSFQNVSEDRTMDQSKRILFKIGLDFLLLFCVGFPILIFFLWGEPYQRGFFCDDESLRHPFHESTVRNWMLYIIGLILPISVMILTEIILASRNGYRPSNIRIFNWDVPEWVKQCYSKIGIFGFGAACSQLTTDIAKYSIGRLRPHFYNLCQPIRADGTTCNDPQNHGIYIEDFHCINEQTDRLLKEMRLSFPSGHASFSAYTLIYLAFYLQARMTWSGSKLVRHVLQFGFLMMFWFTALSRVSDYKHHWSDVLGGAFIGVTCAVLVVRYISDLFVNSTKEGSSLPISRRDLDTPSNGEL
ncbi:putative phosphatidate phosphatase [Phlebotomus papatasi]|uniref:putative phosphatidate phosphatase n=1 Tax=Phlebotomus papatasi TaxID=29031 RepID=UPI00248460C4|nr:putative phosphatidate phosphatase [Phlebotomus papatasi]XP_055701138.1 putative phosphatidate phosphatase [Phlebotomus papatasi]XP_055701139.1 putative phosphatidate phosphatase [Phlebotomus papatasi]